VPQWTAVRVWRAGRRRDRQVREVPVPDSLAAPQAAPQFRHLTAPGYPSAGNPGKEVMSLTITLSAALALGATVFILCRYAGLKILHAAVCVIFGFYLASSSLAPDIANITQSLFRLL
jgi:hypothetical protein